MIKYNLQYRRTILRNAGFIWLEDRLPELFDWVALYLVDNEFRWQEIAALDMDDIVEVLATVKAHVEYSQWKRNNQYVDNTFLNSEAINMSERCKQVLQANMQYWQPLQVMR